MQNTFLRGQNVIQGSMFSYVDIEDRLPASHPLRKVKIFVDGILCSMNDDFQRHHSRLGRPSIPPERLLRALLLQALYPIRSERQLMEKLDYNLLFRWFVGLGINDPVWERTAFCANRDRCFEQNLLRQFFDLVVGVAGWANLVSDDHFSVDGSMIEAWASHKSFVRREDEDGEPPSGPGSGSLEADFKGEWRSNDTHFSTTDPDARLYKKAQFAEPKLRHPTHILSENRNGLVVDVETTQTNRLEEREAAEKWHKGQCRLFRAEARQKIE